MIECIKHQSSHARIMRTTLDIDDAILQELKQLQSERGQSLGRLTSDLLARALAERRQGLPSAPAFRWRTRPMGARVNLSDSGALLDALDDTLQSGPEGQPARALLGSRRQPA